MNRPRPSILAQFDPLLAETEPDYASDSEDESDPNKENLVPELDELSMTAFFSRTYKREYTQPAALTKRLVDIGDVTIAETADEGEDEEAAVSGENVFSLETPKRSNNVRPLPRSAPRTPLAEISVDFKSIDTPIQKKVVVSPTQLPRDTISSLTSLVDSINLAGKSFGHVQRHISPPRITVDKSDTENDILTTPAPFNLQSSTSSLQDASNVLEVSLLALPTPPTVSKESNRLSLDLHSSFNLHLQSETSFDLLNDRISFFDAQGKGMSSFLNALDDDSDMETSEHDTPTTSPSTSCDDDDTTPTQETKVIRNTQSHDRSSPASPLAQLKEPSLSPEISSQRSPLVFGPLVKQSNSLVTPAVHRTVPTVPALRIIKRTKRYDDERTSTSSTSSSSSTVNSGSRKKTPSPPLQSPPFEVHGPRPPSKNSFRQEGPTRTIVADHVASMTAKTATQAPRPKIGALSGTSGPKRILLPEIIKPNKPEAGPSTSARPRVPVPTTGIINAKSASGVASGVPKAAGTSGILLPASRLPAPSGIARFGRKASAPATTEPSSRMAPVRGIPRRYPTYGS
ncbi:hypothetical protein F5050DRAFT_1805796 [Lentinula boryana]|uniref:Uncharacterized protein n=1 Tax=Lentinula boryana TaxID=40481 RepID=A0ABQ8QJ54_9AGAR|nr:hypothetical protein F5050DRAFT_1805796 [Lentinula boryana]